MKKPNGIQKICLPAPAKINLFLAVPRIRADGFHEIFSVLAKLELQDLISIEATSQENELTFECIGTNQLEGVDNLVLQAVRVWRELTKVQLGFRLILKKRIPIEAGLGGGSSDAVSTLIGLNSFLDTPLTYHALHNLSLKIGSDCPSFLTSGLCIAEGRGDKISSIEEPLLADLMNREVLLFKPPIGFSTAEMYSKLVQSRAYSCDKQTSLLFSSWIKGKLPTEDFLFNQFQSTVFSKHLYYLPLFEEITLKFGIKPLLSGSGSCCFCLGKSGIRMEEVEEVIRKAWGEDCCLIRTRFRGKEKHSILFS